MAGSLPQPVRGALLALARRSAETFVREGRHLRPGEDFERVAPERRGAFVTLTTSDGNLRGCIGTILPRAPLDETVARMAVAAAVEDPRFPPVAASELPSLRFEISALTVPEPVTDPALVEIGRHGLIVSRGPFKGLLLPQVPLEWGWGREEFLAHTCEKAGLHAGAWKEPETRLEWFEAEVWGEAG